MTAKTLLLVLICHTSPTAAHAQQCAIMAKQDLAGPAACFAYRNRLAEVLSQRGYKLTFSLCRLQGEKA